MNQPLTPEVAPKKGMSTVVKVLLGCGVLLFLLVGSCVVVGGYFAKKTIGGLADFAKEMESNPDAAAVKAAAMALRLNPEVEVISSDPAAGTITVRERKTGKEVIFDLEDIKAGKFSVTTDGEKSTIDIDATGENGGQMKVVTDQGTAVFGAGGGKTPEWIPAYPGARTEGLANIEAKGEKSGTFTLRTADAPDVVTAFFESKLKEAGFEVQKASLSFNGAPSGTLSATIDSGKRQLSITAAAQDGETQALVAYNEKP
ncbi:MAG: hypothetical protein KBA72_15095 [Thermoanaerobaculia bacterium]|nr:hypothetical protein [Thermoanaerobaculia bacterium]